MTKVEALVSSPHSQVCTMKKWIMQICIKRPNGDHEWRSLRASGSIVWTFTTESEAKSVLQRLRPEGVWGDDIRVIQED